MEQISDKNQLLALISLLDEPDEEVFSRIKIRIFSYGAEAIPVLEKTTFETMDSLIRERALEIMQDIREDELSREFRIWMETSSSDLLKGYLLASRIHYPSLDEGKLVIDIEQMKLDAWLELNDNLTALENIKVLNHILYKIKGFESNKVNPFSPGNFYLNTLLESHQGNALTLGMLYIIIAQKLKIPVYGVNLPQHFILAYTSGLTTAIPSGEDVLFYIDPFNKGNIFTRREIELFIYQLKMKLDPSYFMPCSNIDIIRRWFKGLIVSYTQQGDQGKMDSIKRILHVLTPKGEDEDIL
ncbi:MAG: transglutaminase-like domain-containing protein [Bacteroidota bacterium]|nr:transglutaminase-like domain-containing protein [Bacteroidota bacterium]